MQRQGRTSEKEDTDLECREDMSALYDSDVDSTTPASNIPSDVHGISEDEVAWENESGDPGSDLLYSARDRQTIKRLPWNNLIAKLSQSRPKQFIVHSLHRCQSESEAKCLAEEILLVRHSKYINHQHRRKGFLIAGFHPSESLPHLHVVHDCRWSQSRCRCAWAAKLTRMANSKIRASKYNNLSDEDLVRIAEYVLAGARREILVEIGGEQWTIYYQGGTLPVGQGEGQGCGGLVEEQRDEGLRDGARTSSGDGDNGATTSTAETTTRKSTGRGSRMRSLKVLNILDKYVISPPDNVIMTDVYVEDLELLVYRHNTPFIGNSINLVKRKINKLSLKELVFYQRDRIIYYEHMDFDSCCKYYLNIDDSILACLRLLLFQFEDILVVKSFLKTLSQFINKSLPNPKVNTLFIKGPPNAGKNFFFDSVCCLCINYGKIENPSRSNSFPFMNGVNRRVNKWNEATIDPAFYENVLDLMQGNVIYANVKYEPYTPISKTPLIVLGNKDVFPNEERFSCRHIRFEWRACELLKEYNQKPHPLAIGLLCLWALDDKDVNVELVDNLLYTII